ncbi:YihY/virulence factor BrkB family protein [Aquibacillus sp. 3ASR75-11]|uniref:YihY/virulence factor BrkB family protein n=1 Tax=Terrihalobacillus insolitus TaxID=2950438 RepID=A0A9X3WUV3_9BACI|nr:YihY/virulence factor BrkB family protein [Terrihalobacillus insolitus]MDC3413461.1 YihY/virulence factor BrkB family protein [Terrihalobacillus insolitus]MDC3425248.1 YihY/virulence factor BrkB family protein [Terrihalobacillus insolitus]
MQVIVTFTTRLMMRIMNDDLVGLAAQLSYFFLLSLFPFLFFLITLVGFLPIEQVDILRFLNNYAPTQTAEMINQNLSEIVSRRDGGLLSFGIIGTIWAASNGINAIMRAFNSAYEVEEDRPFYLSRIISIVLTIAMIFVIVIAFLLPIFGKAIGVYLFSFVGLSNDFVDWWNMIRWIISSIVFFIVLLSLYKLAPNQFVSFHHAFPGAVFGTIGWQLVSLAFSYYVNTMGNYTAMYGSLGGVIVLMVWFFISGMIIIIGGEINAEIEQIKKDQKGR